jgi:dienelactone hydrolase
MLMRTLACIATVVGGLALAADGAVKTERIEYTVGGATYEGVLAYDDAVEGRRPGVLVCPEWWGRNQYAEARARMLAESGCVAFAIDVYGKGKVTTDPKQAQEWSSALMDNYPRMNQISAEALRVLAEHPRVERTALAAIGYCMGGTVALELARSNAEHTRFLQVVGAFHTSRIAAQDERANRRIAGTVLIFHGRDDTFVPPEELAEFHRQMSAVAVDTVFTSYSGAQHSFTNPRADEFGIKGVKYNQKADMRSWDLLLDTLREKFPRTLGAVKDGERAAGDAKKEADGGAAAPKGEPAPAAEP